MTLKNKTYSSYYIDEIDNYGDLRDAVKSLETKFMTIMNFCFLMIKISQYLFLEKISIMR